MTLKSGTGRKVAISFSAWPGARLSTALMMAWNGSLPPRRSGRTSSSSGSWLMGTSVRNGWQKQAWPDDAVRQAKFGRNVDQPSCSHELEDERIDGNQLAEACEPKKKRAADQQRQRPERDGQIEEPKPAERRSFGDEIL